MGKQMDKMTQGLDEGVGYRGEEENKEEPEREILNGPWVGLSGKRS